jgi:hypothetical protein
MALHIRKVTFGAIIPKKQLELEFTDIPLLQNLKMWNNSYVSHTGTVNVSALCYITGIVR